MSDGEVRDPIEETVIAHLSNLFSLFLFYSDRQKQKFLEFQESLDLGPSYEQLEEKEDPLLSSFRRFL